MLDAFFKPQTVAVIGASSNPSKLYLHFEGLDPVSCQSEMFVQLLEPMVPFGCVLHFSHFSLPTLFRDK